LFRLADNRDPQSIAGRLRRRRFAMLQRLLAAVPHPVRILDVGGRQGYWDVAAPDFDAHVTLLNVEPQAVTRAGFEFALGDARSLARFGDKSFDLVFSNSVIEHVGDRSDQQAVADEIRRVGVRYYVQTPNYGFPIEPHFLFPGFQFLPVSARVALLTRFQLGWMPRTPDPEEARRVVESVRLLRERDLAALFPDGELHRETFAGLTKSLIVVGGF
jgi:hypothetical protein